MTLYAAAFAYYAFLAVFPLMLLVMAIIGAVFRSRPDLQARAINYILQTLPSFGAGFREALEGIIAHSLTLGLVGFIGVLWSGSGFANALDAGFAVIWGSPPRKFWQRRIRGLEVILAIMGVGIMGFIVNYGANRLPSAASLRFVLSLILALFLNWVLLMAIYVIVPRRRIHWREVMTGALAAAVLWYATQIILQIYYSSLANVNELYGIFGAVLGLLVWLFIGGLIIFFGSELNVVLYKRSGHELAD